MREAKSRASDATGAPAGGQIVVASEWQCTTPKSDSPQSTERAGSVEVNWCGTTN